MDVGTRIAVTDLDRLGICLGAQLLAEVHVEDVYAHRMDALWPEVRDELRDLRGSKISMVYQEPMASLNPAMKIGKQLMEVPMIHEGMSQQDAWDLARQIVADATRNGNYPPLMLEPIDFLGL